jgi:hypothetical protein
MLLKSVLMHGVLMGIAATGLMADEPQREPRVRAKEPTVVTVRGQQDRVETAEPRARHNPLARVGHGVKTGALKVAGGVVSFTGWLLDVDDDVPSERERGRKTESR